MSQPEPILLDLRGTPCPINFVRTKLKLSQMSQGQILEVWLDSGEPIEQVPHSLKVAGYDDQTLEEVDNFFKLSIRLGLEH
ncbi:MAG: sulfurtransferase TusA family protein [Snowella sp.]|nr:sulfurtransferase TusA family protein [Snowella sp.]